MPTACGGVVPNLSPLIFQFHLTAEFVVRLRSAYLRYTPRVKMTAPKDAFTSEDYAHANQFGLSLDQIAAADEEIADLERVNAKGFNPDRFLDMSWANEILAQTQPTLRPASPIDTALPQAGGQPVQLAPAPEETPIPEPPWRMQEAEAKAPPMQEAPEETPAPEPPWKMQKAEAKAEPMQEVRFFCN